MFIRFTLASVLMGAIFCRRLGRMSWVIARRGSIVGLALCAANLSFVIGVSGTTVSRAGFLNNLFVLLIPLICYVFWREKVDRWSLAGIGLALIGLWQLARGGAAGFTTGDIYSTVCALFIALHIILVSRVLKDEDVLLVTLVQFITVALVGGLLHAILPGQEFRLTPTALGSLAYCAIFPTIICFTLQNTYQRYKTPTQAGLIYTLDPVWSMLGGMLILGERLSRGEWLGCGLIFAAVVVPMAAKRLRERRLGVGYRDLS